MKSQRKTVVIGVSSGIAAYKTIELIKSLRKKLIEVYVVMTDSATKMVDPKDFEKASGNKVYTELFEKGFDYKNVLKKREVDHIALADKADLIVVAPATANIIAKIANGIADDFLTTMILASSSPILLCPSMNVHMWQNPITQKNISKLKDIGMIFLGPDEGMLACGYEGIGRLSDVAAIEQEVLKLASQGSALRGQVPDGTWRGKKVAVTAGGTIEPIDDVRFIGNHSSGKMGAAIADAAFLNGADVLFLHSQNCVFPRYHIKKKSFSTASGLSLLVEQEIKDADIIFHTAAVSDFKVSNKKRGKINSSKRISLNLSPTQKISDRIKKINPNIFLVVFKAEATSDKNELIKRGKEKLKDSDADMVVVNDVSRNDRGFIADNNEVYVITKNSIVTHFPLASKGKIAEQIIRLVIATLSRSKGRQS